MVLSKIKGMSTVACHSELRRQRGIPGETAKGIPRFARNDTLACALLLLFAATASATEITPDTVVAAMNARRAFIGLPALHRDARLDQAALDRINEMEEQEYWSHVGPTGHSPFELLKPHGYDFWYAGENLAAGFETTEVMMDGWMESPGHRENILSPMFTECGVAVLEGRTTGRGNGWSVVVMFARPLPTVQPSLDRRRVSTQASRR